MALPSKTHKGCPSRLSSPRIYPTKRAVLFHLKGDYNSALVTAMPKKTAIETRVPSTRDIRKISGVLERVYGNPRHGNPRRPLDDLIYIILSTRTRDLK